MHKVTRWRRQLKSKAIEYKGSKCSVCGYDRCQTALEFHHIDPGEKDFKICSKNCMAWDRVKKELDKCILICANCHRELHAYVAE